MWQDFAQRRISGSLLGGTFGNPILFNLNKIFNYKYQYTKWHNIERCKHNIEQTLWGMKIHITTFYLHEVQNRQEVMYALRNLESGEKGWLELGTKEATVWLDMFYFLRWIMITRIILGLWKVHWTCDMIIFHEYVALQRHKIIPSHTPQYSPLNSSQTSCVADRLSFGGTAAILWPWGQNTHTRNHGA